MLRIVTDSQQPAPATSSPGGQASAGQVAMMVEPGHYYSPVPDDRELRREPRFSQLWPAQPRETVGINWRAERQLAICRDVFAKQERMQFADEETLDPSTYFAKNGQYPALDAWILEGMLRALQPKRMIEVGSGYSSLVTAAVNRTYFDYDLDFTCIEPNPRQFLTDGVAGIEAVVPYKVQDVPLELFAKLGDGDVLFIDTSHVVKTGGDVPWIYNEILPRLAPGVHVHIHDIFLPQEYLQKWVFDGRAWNEQYLVQSFLAFNDVFEVVFGTYWMLTFHPDQLAVAFPDMSRYGQRGGCSFWMRRAGGQAELLPGI
jgi:predicted O-methyltransferase YrrM